MPAGGTPSHRDTVTRGAVFGVEYTRRLSAGRRSRAVCARTRRGGGSRAFHWSLPTEDELQRACRGSQSRELEARIA
jgi:phage-related protein